MIGLYEAPDGENEALFIADRISRYLREAGQSEDLPRCAVLYRTNSQSRLVEEALRRYQVQYHMVGGFSFYERAEVKDLLSYMKSWSSTRMTRSRWAEWSTPRRAASARQRWRRWSASRWPQASVRGMRSRAPGRNSCCRPAR